MCRSKAEGGRRCTGSTKTHVTEASVPALSSDGEVNHINLKTPTNPDTPNLNKLLTISNEEWFAISWKDRKKIAEQAFHEALNTTGIDTRWGGWDRRTQKFGVTVWTRRSFNDPWSSEIRLSDPNGRYSTAFNIANTILHELAHARAGHTEDHGLKWRETFAELGETFSMNPEIVANREMNETELMEYRKAVQAKRDKPPAWIGTCPQGHRFPAGREPKLLYSCVKCAQDGYTFEQKIITYERNTNKEKL